MFRLFTIFGLVLSHAAVADIAEDKLPPLDTNIAQCRALIAEIKGRQHRPSKSELYRVGNAAGLLCDTFTDAEFDRIFVIPAGDR